MCKCGQVRCADNATRSPVLIEFVRRQALRKNDVVESVWRTLEAGFPVGLYVDGPSEFCSCVLTLSNILNFEEIVGRPKL